MTRRLLQSPHVHAARSVETSVGSEPIQKRENVIGGEQSRLRMGSHDYVQLMLRFRKKLVREDRGLNRKRARLLFEFDPDRINNLCALLGDLGNRDGRNPGAILSLSCPHRGHWAAR